jgi:CheY-like chemotaxis protein
MNVAKSNFGAKTTVFVVDDEPVLLMLIGEFLQTLPGCTVRTFRDPETALKEITAAPPDVVVTDYAMGRMTGMDLIRECRRLQPTQKIILISGTVDEEIFADAPCKPDKFLRKPDDVPAISDHVRALLAA